MEKYTIDDLLGIIARLRKPDGCPWDRVQTHESIKNGLIEECYEVVDAIDKGDFSALKEELGDVLMQVVFHSSLAYDEGQFDFSDVVNGVCEKLIYRHPHIFSDTVADSVDKVLENWDELKKKEKKHTTYTDTLKSVPDSFPALLKAAKVQKRAAKAGFDYDSAYLPYKKVLEETAELKQAMDKKSEEEIFEEFGDLLFAAVNLSRFLEINPEEALRKATDKFTMRFEQVEKEVIKGNKKMTDLTLLELDEIWEKVKLLSKSESF